jgi:hypothetical protein
VIISIFSYYGSFAQFNSYLTSPALDLSIPDHQLILVPNIVSFVLSIVYYLEHQLKNILAPLWNDITKASYNRFSQKGGEEQHA